MAKKEATNVTLTSDGVNPAIMVDIETAGRASLPPQVVELSHGDGDGADDSPTASSSSNSSIPSDTACTTTTNSGDEDEMFLMKMIIQRSAGSKSIFSAETDEDNEEPDGVATESSSKASVYVEQVPLESSLPGSAKSQHPAAHRFLGGCRPGAISVPGILDDTDIEDYSALEEGRHSALLLGLMEQAEDETNMGTIQAVDPGQQLPIAARLVHGTRSEEFGYDPSLSESLRLRHQLSKADDHTLLEILQQRNSTSLAVATKAQDSATAADVSETQSELKKWFQRGIVMVLILILALLGLVFLSQQTK